MHSLEFKHKDPLGEACYKAFDRSITALRQTLGDHLDTLLQNWTFEIGNELTESGAEVDHENRRILLDAEKNSMSIHVAEAKLIEDGVLDAGDWTRVLPDVQNEPWSLLTYNIVHEIGHLLSLDIPPEHAPTKYGREQPGEAGPEAFAYFVFEGPLQAQTYDSIKEMIAGGSK